jgi:hypothetical protein
LSCEAFVIVDKLRHCSFLFAPVAVLGKILAATGIHPCADMRSNAAIGFEPLSQGFCRAGWRRPNEFWIRPDAWRSIFDNIAEMAVDAARMLRDMDSLRIQDKISGISVVWARVSGAGLCSLFSNFRFWGGETGSTVAGDRFGPDRGAGLTASVGSFV